MLVLSRQRDESVYIGGANGIPLMKITIVDIRGDKVRMGFDVPKEVPIHREEVYEAIQREQARAKGGEST